MSTRSVFLSAGDPSGDNASARLVTSLVRLRPELTFFGLGGEKLRRLGQEQLADGRELAVLGFWEVAKRFRFFSHLLRRTAEEIKKRRPACVILVDYPGFNLRLAERIKPLGIPIVYYISPQVWAWGRKRVSQIRRLVDLMLLILPFEEEFYRESGVRCRFVGHYLLEDIPEEFVRSPLPQGARLALLPGSRPQEIERMLPVMLEAAKRFNGRHGTAAVVAGIKNVFPYERYVGGPNDSDISVVYGDARRLIHDSTLVLTASGTATLETAIIGRPMVVVYKTGFITYQIARRLVKLDKIALANLVLSAKVVPELIQGDATPDRIAAELDRFQSDERYRDAVTARLREVPDLLGGKGASDRAAQMVCEHL